jgi:hypothetical protein
MLDENIKLVRLISGEELIGKVQVNPQGVQIEKPAIIIVQPPQRQGDRMGIALVGWLPYTMAEKNGVHIKQEHVLFTVDPEPSLLKSYRERFSAQGLVVPQPELKSGLVLPSFTPPR